MTNRLRFRNRIKKQLRPLAFAALGFASLTGCQSKKMVVKNPIIEYVKKDPAKGSWKDGKCWVEGNDTVVYSFRIGDKTEVKRFRTDAFLEDGEKVFEVICSERGTYLLTERLKKIESKEKGTFWLKEGYIVMLEGAKTAYFGKSDRSLVNGRMKLDLPKKNIISWYPNEESIFILTKNSLVYVDLLNKQDRTIEGQFSEKTKLKYYNGVLLVVTPSSDQFLMSFKPGDEKAPRYKVNFLLVGDVLFKENEDHLIIAVGEDKIKLKIEEGKINLTLVR
jgi:hypothetical protein